jgi:hypothetical protein
MDVLNIKQWLESTKCVVELFFEFFEKLFFEKLTMSEHVWTCLLKYLILSNYVWSTVGQNCTNFDKSVWSCLILFDRVWSCLIKFLIMSDHVSDHVWSCLIMSDHVWSTVASAEILESLIKGFPRTRTTRTTRTRTTKQNVDPAVYYVYSQIFFFEKDQARSSCHATSNRKLFQTQVTFPQQTEGNQTLAGRTSSFLDDPSTITCF